MTCSHPAPAIEMIEPVTLAHEVVSHISAIAQLATYTKSYIDSIRNAPDSCRNLSNKIQDLLGVFEMARIVLLEFQQADLGTHFASAIEENLTLLKSMMDNCATQLRQLNRLMKQTPNPSSSTVGSKLKWEPLSWRLTWIVTESRTWSIIQKLENVRTSMQALIQILQAAHALRVNASQRATESIRVVRDLVQWLEPHKYDKRHQKVVALRHPGSCQWLFLNKMFQEWRSSRRSWLWLNGDANSGKTVLASAIIDDLKTDEPFQKVPIAYYYCDPGDPSSADLPTILRTIWCQLILRQQEVVSWCSIHEDLLLKMRHHEAPPVRPEVLVQYLLKAIRAINACSTCCATPIIVIDAIDELRGSRYRSLVGVLENLIAEDVRLFITSRRSVDTSSKFNSICLDNHINEISEEMNTYMIDNLLKHRRLADYGEEVKRGMRSDLLRRKGPLFHHCLPVFNAFKPTVTAQNIWAAFVHQFDGTSIMDAMLYAMIEQMDGTMLRYSVELSAAGLIENPFTSLSVPTRLSLLSSGKNAWAQLEDPQPQCIDLYFASLGTAHFEEGLMMVGQKGSSNRNTRWDSADTVRVLSSQLLRDVGHLDNHRELWSEIHTQASILDFDTSVKINDLIALVTYSVQNSKGQVFCTVSIDVYLYKLSTGGSHSGASRPVLHVCDVPFKENHSRPNVQVHVFGDYLGIMIKSPLGSTDPTVFKVFDWRSGTQLAYLSPSVPAAYRSFAFVAANVLVLPNIAKNSLDLYYLNVPPDGATCPLQLSCSLALPAVKGCIHNMVVTSQPFTGLESDGWPINDTRLFRPDPERAIMLFHVCVMDSKQVKHWFKLVLHRTSLLSLLPLCSSALPSTKSPTPWSSWGPPICRWFSHIPNQVHTLAVPYGQRFARMSQHTRGTVEILDFNPVAMTRFTDSETNCTEPEDLCSPVFAEAVRSELPYMMTRIRKTYQYDNVRLTGDALIGIELNERYNKQYSRFCIHHITGSTALYDH